MSTAVSTTQDFQQRMFEKIRDQMGDLLTDEDLQKIIAAAVEKAFFQPVRRERSYGGYEEGEPVFVTLVRRQLETQVKAAAELWLAGNNDRVDAVIREQLADGIVELLRRHIDNKFSTPMQVLHRSLVESGLLRN
jgi:hypothetical protein